MEYEYNHDDISGIVDGRFLALEFEFFDMPEEKSVSLLKESFLYLYRLLYGNVNGVWYTGMRIRRGIHDPDADKIEKLIRNNRDLSYEGWITKDLSKSLRNEYIDVARQTASWIFPQESLDYNQYYQKYILDAETPAELRQGILDLFRLPNKYYLTDKMHPFDVYLEGRIHNPYWINTITGKMLFCIKVCCLGKYTSFMADTLSMFLRSMGEQYLNINGQISLAEWPLNQNTYVHDHYFFVHRSGNSVYGPEYPHFLRHRLYAYGIDWANLISPTVIRNTHLDVDSNKPLYLQATKDIMNYEAEDLTDIKKAIRPALKPGWREVSMETMKKPTSSSRPRRRWEKLLLEENEIDVTDDGIVYKFISS